MLPIDGKSNHPKPYRVPVTREPAAVSSCPVGRVVCKCLDRQRAHCGPGRLQHKPGSDSQEDEDGSGHR